jgi:L1 cell adhesion molecule like protein
MFLIFRKFSLKSQKFFRFDNEIVQEAIAKSVVPIESNADGFPEWVVSHVTHDSNGEEISSKAVRYSCSDLVSILLGSLKQSAETYTGCPVDKCVLSYPTNFTAAQQKALVASANQVALEVTSLIPEPIAACLAHEHRMRTEQSLGCNGVTLVADIGATSTTFTLGNIFAGLFTTTAHTTIPFGGIDLDRVLFAHFVSEFKKKTGHDVTGNRKAEEKLMLACEVTRKVLSTNNTANCHVESFYEGIDYVSVINRIRFDSLSGKWKKRFEEAVMEFLDNQSIDRDEIDHVLCVGGVCKTPFIVALFGNLFGRASINNEIDGDDVTAYGTAIHGLQDSQHHSEAREHNDREVESPHLLHPLGILDSNGSFVTVVPRYSPLPLRHAVAIDVNSASVCLKIAEGREIVPIPEEGEDSNDEDEGVALYAGTEVGQLMLVSPNGAIFDRIELTLSVKEDGCVHVAAHGASPKLKEKVHVTLDL